MGCTEPDESNLIPRVFLKGNSNIIRQFVVRFPK